MNNIEFERAVLINRPFDVASPERSPAPMHPVRSAILFAPGLTFSACSPSLRHHHGRPYRSQSSLGPSRRSWHMRKPLSDRSRCHPGVNERDISAFEIPHVARDQNCAPRSGYGRDPAIRLSNGAACMATRGRNLRVGSGSHTVERQNPIREAFKPSGHGGF